MMNGAESLVQTLVAGGVDVCFTNPGTSEMHFVAALDRVEGMRCVLGLFEGVVTGAADGYYRMKGTPASTLLHLGPGLANGLANLHNAKKAHSGIVNIVGQHATYHISYNAPLTSDIEGLARPMSAWVRTSPDAKSVSADGAAAIAAAKSAPPQIATLILPADTAWNEAGGIAEVATDSQRPSFSPQAVEEAAKVLKSNGSETLVLVTGDGLTEKGLAAAERIAGKTGCKVMGQTYHPKMARGRGRFSIDRIPYAVDLALPILKNFKHIVLVEANEPIAFFAYPNKPSVLKPEGCEVHRMTSWGENSVAALEALANTLGAKPSDVKPQKHMELVKPTGGLNHTTIAQAIAYALPENAIVIDESITTGRGFFPPTAGAAPHDWLQEKGGSIGFFPPGPASPRRPPAPGRMTGCRTWAARSASRRRSPPAPRSPVRTARCSAWSATALRCTRSRPCGRRRARISTSSPSCSPTASTRSCAASSTASAPANPASGRKTCSSSTGRPSISSRWPRASASRVARSARRMNSMRRSPKRLPSPVRG